MRGIAERQQAKAIGLTGSLLEHYKAESGRIGSARRRGGVVSAYRRIGVSAWRRGGVSAWRRIGVSAWSGGYDSTPTRSPKAGGFPNPPRRRSRRRQLSGRAVAPRSEAAPRYFAPADKKTDDDENDDDDEDDC